MHILFLWYHAFLLQTCSGFELCLQLFLHQIMSYNRNIISLLWGTGRAGSGSKIPPPLIFSSLKWHHLPSFLFNTFVKTKQKKPPEQSYFLSKAHLNFKLSQLSRRLFIKVHKYLAQEDNFLNNPYYSRFVNVMCLPARLLRWHLLWE